MKIQKKKTILILVLIIIIILIILNSLSKSTNMDQNKLQADSDKIRKFMLEINQNRINKLLNILQEKQLKFKEILSFTADSDAEQFLTSNNSVTEKFVDYLNNISNYLSPSSTDIDQSSFQTSSLVIVTAANSEFYLPLQSTVYNVHQKFNDSLLIIYDLGLSETMRKKTIEKCKCKLISFNFSQYSKVAPHIKDLKNYAWKPLIIQEVLQTHKTVLYIDSSIRFKTNKISSIIEKIKTTGTTAQRLMNTSLSCYTNPKMFKWFKEEPSSYDNFDSIEANIIFFYKNFLSSLIMKAWIICALDESCIAPKGSRLYNWFTSCSSCGCHRYDQDALTIIYSFFFGYPKQSDKFDPAYAFSKNEYFFEIKRREGMNYFDK